MAVTKILTQLKTINGYLAETEDIKDESANTSLKDTLDKLKNNLFFHGIIAQAGVVTDTVIPNQTPASLIVYSVAQKRFYITNTTPEEFAEGTIEALYTKWDNSLDYNKSDNKTSICRSDKTFFCLDIRSTGLTGLYTFNDETSSLEIIAGENIITKNNIANDAITSSKIKKETVNLEHLSVVLQNLIGVIDGSGGMALTPNKIVITDKDGALSVAEDSGTDLISYSEITTELEKDDVREQLERIVLALNDENIAALIGSDAILLDQLAPEIRDAISEGGGGNILNYYSSIIRLDDDLNSLISADGMIVGLTGTMPADGVNSVVSDSMVISFGRKESSDTVNYGIQIASCISNGKIYTRTLYGGTWGSWNVIGGSGSSSDSSDIELAANKIVITDENGKLTTSSNSSIISGVTVNIDYALDTLSGQINNNSNSINDLKVITNIENSIFRGIISTKNNSKITINTTTFITSSSSSKIIYDSTNSRFYITNDVLKDLIDTNIGGIIYANWDTMLAYNENEDIYSACRADKLFFNTGSINAYRHPRGNYCWNEDIYSLGLVVTEHDTAGSMIPFKGILNGSQLINIQLIYSDYITQYDDEEVESPMGIYYYQNSGSDGFFIAISDFGIEQAASGIIVNGYTFFYNSILYNDETDNPIAREDQLFIIKGNAGGVYRYIGDSKNLTKLF